MITISESMFIFVLFCLVLIILFTYGWGWKRGAKTGRGWQGIKRPHPWPKPPLTEGTKRHDPKYPSGKPIITPPAPMPRTKEPKEPPFTLTFPLCQGKIIEAQGYFKYGEAFYQWEVKEKK